MATGSYEYKYVSAETTTAEVKSQTWAFIGSRQSGLASNVRNNVPKYAAINSATCTIRIKRDGSSDLSLYHHDVDWIITNSAGSVTETLQSENNAISRSYKTFTYNCLSYMNSKGANAGVATSIYLLSFKASGDLAKKYTYDTYKFNMTYTLPTITVKGEVNDANYGRIVTDGSFALGSPVDIYADKSNKNKRREIDAVPNEGYRFVQWSDGVTESYRVVDLDEDSLTSHNTTLTYKAIFEPVYTITANASPTEGGTVTGGGEYGSGESVTLTATANDGYEFVRWSDGIEGATRIIIANGNLTFTAQFERNVFTVTTDTICDDGTAGGTVIGGGEYTRGESAKLTATPNEHYTFVQWSDGVTEPTREVTVTEDVTYTAEFIVTLYQIDVMTKPTILHGAQSRGWYPYGEEVTLTAKEQTGFEFVGWEDGVTDATRTIIVTGDDTYVAVYKAVKCTITTQVIPEGAGIVSGGGVYDYGTYVDLIVIITGDYKFVEWSDGVTSANRNIKVEGDATYTAEFEKIATSNTFRGTSRQTAFGGTVKQTVYKGTTKIS